MQKHIMLAPKRLLRRPMKQCIHKHAEIYL
jgi:hypothetical protein